MRESMGPFYGKFKFLSNVVLCQVWLNLTQWFWKHVYRRTDAGHYNDQKKITSAFQSGELNWWLLLNSLKRKVVFQDICQKKWSLGLKKCEWHIFSQMYKCNSDTNIPSNYTPKTTESISLSSMLFIQDPFFYIEKQLH